MPKQSTRAAASESVLVDPWILRKIRARLVADFVPGLVFRINLNVAAKMASQKYHTCF